MTLHMMYAMALKAPRSEICQKCVTQWYCTLLLESLNSSGSSCIPSMAVHSNMKPERPLFSQHTRMWMEIAQFLLNLQW